MSQRGCGQGAYQKRVADVLIRGPEVVHHGRVHDVRDPVDEQDRLLSQRLPGIKH